MIPRRRLLTKNSALGLGALLVLCLLLLAALSQTLRGTAAVVEQGGKEVLRVELSSLTGPMERELSGENGIVLTLRFSTEGAQVLSSACPDKVCVRTGLLTHAGETAVCLPAGVSLRLEGQRTADAATF